MREQIKFPSVIKNISYAENLVDKISEKYDLSSELYGNVVVSLVETVNNAITHGNSLNPNKIVKIESHIDDDILEFIVSDEGNGFDYNDLPDPTSNENIEKPFGRGIFLMKHLADEVKYSNSGSTVHLTFNIKK